MKLLFAILLVVLINGAIYSSINNTPNIFIPTLTLQEEPSFIRSPTRDLVGIYAEKYGIDRYRWHKLIELESSWRWKVVSKRGATGICQLWPPTARSYGLKGSWKEIQEQLKNPKINVPICARLLRDLLDRYDGDWFLVAVAFNAGPSVITYAQKIERAGQRVAAK